MGRWKDFPGNMDRWLVDDVFEKFAQWWQKTASHKQDCFWWAGMMIPWYALSGAVVVVLVGGIWAVLLIPLLFASVPAGYFLVRRFKREAYESLERNTSNPLKAAFTQQLLRIFETCFLASATVGVVVKGILYAIGDPNAVGLSDLLAEAFAIVSLFFATIFLYFVACDPLPPSEEKSCLEQWFLSLREVPRHAAAPVRS